MAVFFHFNEVSIPLKNRRVLKTYLPSLFLRENCRLQQLHYIFCTDSFLLKINQQYLHHQTLTDIITFDLSEQKGVVDGEVYISGERVRENAREFGVSFEEELHRVIFHGALHLCGYHDKTPAEKRNMRKKENENLQSYFKNGHEKKTS